MSPKPGVFDRELGEIVPSDSIDRKALGFGNHPVISIEDFPYGKITLRVEHGNQAGKRVPAMMEDIEQATPKGM